MCFGLFLRVNSRPGFPCSLAILAVIKTLRGIAGSILIAVPRNYRRIEVCGCGHEEGCKSLQIVTCRHQMRSDPNPLIGQLINVYMYIKRLDKVHV